MADVTSISRALFLLVALCSTTVHCFVTQGAKGCAFDVNEDLPVPSPLILRDQSPPRFRNPDEGSKLQLRSGEALRLSCGDGEAFLIDGASKTEASTDIRVECVGDQAVRVPALGLPQVQLHQLACEHSVVAQVVPNGTCSLPDHPEPESRSLALLRVGFPVDGGFVDTLHICVDSYNKDPVFARSTVSQNIAGHERQVSRPPFAALPESLYGGLDVNLLYNRKVQRRTLATLLQSEELSEFYIKSRGTLFLSRGHLVPKADGVYGAAQRSTFLLANTAPQWHSFNQGNWERVEASVRRLAAQRGELDVVTGIHGVTTLPDVLGVQQPLYLLVDGDRRGVRVPHYFFKAVRDPASNAGVVVVGINNPYNVVTEEDVFCEDVCGELSWLHLPQRRNQVSGYVFCCEVESFRQAVLTLPDFPVTSLLT